MPILIYLISKMCENTKIEHFLPFFRPISGVKLFLCTKACCHEHTSIFIIVAETMNFATVKTVFSQLL